jgi:hypothetical protein
MPTPARKARHPLSTAAVRKIRAVSSPGVTVTSPAARVKAINASTVINSLSIGHARLRIRLQAAPNNINDLMRGFVTGAKTRALLNH